ncbi:MAG: hypothetical protein ACRCZF_07375, partial [Gemmataceae bacterium]
MRRRWMIVFAANALLLTLQLIAGPRLAPFVGNSLETWTALLASCLVGLAAGNLLGARRGSLIVPLLAAAVGTLWLSGAPAVLNLLNLPPGLGRILVFAAVPMMPVSIAVGMLMPRAVQGVGGAAAGRIYATAALGSLVGNYLTGFVLIPNEPLTGLLILSAAGFTLLSFLAMTFLIGERPVLAHAAGKPTAAPPPRLGRLLLAVGLASLACLALELIAARMLAQVVGNSLFTWAGVIGATLAGSALGNLLGARVAPARILAAAAGVLVLLPWWFLLLTILGLWDMWPLPARVLTWSLVLLVVPAVLLGMV